MSKAKKWGKRLRNLIIVLVFFVLFLEWWLNIAPPTIEDTSAWELPRQELSTNSYAIGQNWLRQNEHGLWEVPIVLPEGAP